MIIQVTEYVRIIREDGHNWTIQKMHIAEKGKRAGQEIWTNVGYYGRIEQAANCLLGDKIDLIIDEPARVFNDLREFMVVFEAAAERIRRAMYGTKRKLARKAKNGDRDAKPEEAVPTSEPSSQG